MDDKYFDEQLAEQAPPSSAFIPRGMNEINVTIDNRDHFEEMVMHWSRSSSERPTTAY